MNKDKKVTTKYSVSEKVSALIAQVMLDSNDKFHVIPSRYNRYAVKYGLPKYNRLDLQNFIDTYLAPEKIQKPSQGVHWTILHKVYTHQLTLGDVVGTNETQHEMHRINIEAGSTEPVLHQRMLDTRRKFRKNKRWQARIINDTNDVLEDMGNHMKQYINASNYTPLSTKKHLNTKKTMVVILSDEHIGCCVKIMDRGLSNNYSVTIFKHRFDTYMDKVTKIAKEYDVTHIVLVNLGDQIENLNMRYNQAFTTELNLQAQVNTANIYMIKAIRLLSHLAPTDVLLIQGNHDRVTPRARDNAYGDSFTGIQLEMLLILNKLGAFHNVHIINNKNEIHSGYITINNKHYLFIHGDNFGVKQGKENIGKLETPNRPIDYLIFGHFHNAQTLGGNAGKQQIQVGSIEGHNRFSKRLGMFASNASQTVLLSQRNMPLVHIPVDLSGIQK